MRKLFTANQDGDGDSDNTNKWPERNKSVQRSRSGGGGGSGGSNGNGVRITVFISFILLFDTAPQQPYDTQLNIKKSYSSFARFSFYFITHITYRHECVTRTTSSTATHSVPHFYSRWPRRTCIRNVCVCVCVRPISLKIKKSR